MTVIPLDRIIDLFSLEVAKRKIRRVNCLLNDVPPTWELLQPFRGIDGFMK